MTDPKPVVAAIVFKDRPDGFLSEEYVAHDSEVFDYICELHSILWQIARIAHPETDGCLDERLPLAVANLVPSADFEAERVRVRELEGLLLTAETHRYMLDNNRFGGIPKQAHLLQEDWDAITAALREKVQLRHRDFSAALQAGGTRQGGEDESP